MKTSFCEEKGINHNPNPDLAPFSHFNNQIYYDKNSNSFYHRAMKFCMLKPEKVILKSTEGIFDSWFRKRVMSRKLGNYPYRKVSSVPTNIIFSSFQIKKNPSVVFKIT